MRVEFCRSLLALLSFIAVAVVISAQAADDDGRGLTFEDTTQGECRERSRLDAAAGNELAVVRIDGEWQLITADPVSGAAGVDAAQSVSPVVFFCSVVTPEIHLVAPCVAKADRVLVGLQPGRHA